MKRIVRLLFALPLLLLTACTAEEQYSTKYSCNFIFYTRYHADCALTLVLGNPGQYVIVEPKFVAGVTHHVFTPNTGPWEQHQLDVAMTSAIENKRISYDNMGANRRLIVGSSNFNGLKCYDGQCPNCLEQGGSVNRPLSWADDGKKLRCPRCNIVYNPNAQGIPENGNEDTPRLLEYRVEPYNGESLYIHN